MISFKFEGNLMHALRDSIGKQLKSLTLINITDVNLRSIARYCTNLVRLKMEFISNYEPAIDEPLSSDINNQAWDQVKPIKSLRLLSISNFNIKNI